MDSRKKDESLEDEAFPAYGEGKSSKGKPLSPESEMQKIEYEAPEGFKYEFGYDEKLGRYGYILKPLETQEKPKSEPEENDMQWKKWGDSQDPSPHVVNSFLKSEPREVIKFSAMQLDLKK